VEPIGIVIVALAVAGLAFGSWWLNQARRREWHMRAMKLGLTYSRGDPFGLLGLPFGLFSKGDDRGIDHTASGHFGDREVKLFDYWYYDESTDSKGNRSRTYSRFTCAVAEVGVPLPHLSIGREGVLSRLAAAVGFRDIEFESEEFNRRFKVKGDDRRFATYVVDARMMEWLLHADPANTFEIAERWLLVHIHRLRPRELPLLLLALTGFEDKIPDVVWDVYGKAG